MMDKEKVSKQEKATNAREINLDELEKVTGAGNPFADVERVSTKEIDDNLREKI